MGYKISTLATLPVVPGIRLYVFVLGERAWDEGFRASIEANFSRLAKHLGGSAAIVTGHEGTNLIPELINAASKRPDLARLIEREESGGGGILILGAHPTTLGADDVLLYSPFRVLEKRFHGFDQFADELCNFVVGRDSAFLDKFEERGDLASEALDIIELKPSIFGLGLNIGAAIRKIRMNRHK